MASQSSKLIKEPASPFGRSGRDEMNLAEFPIASIADRVAKNQKTLYFEDGNGRLTITGSDAYGLPTAVDSDVIVALIYLTKQRNNFSDEKVNFSRYELIKLLNWHDEGGSYKRLEQSFHRWSGVLLVYDKCWWNNRTKKYVSANMHIIDSVIFAEPTAISRDGQSSLPLSMFTWNKTFIDSCQADNLRQLDLDTYFSLKSAVSKRLYRFLGKRFYRQGDWSFDLNEIAFDRVGLSRSYEGNAGKIKEKLQPAIDELETIGFLEPLSRDDRYSRIDRGQWNIRLTRQSSALVTPQPVITSASEPSPLAAELIDRGITAAIADQLVTEYDEARIRLQMDILDAMPAKKRGRIDDPAAWLVTAIRNDHAAPKGYVPKAERERQAEAKRQKEQQAAEERHRKQEQQAREKAERQAILGYWESLNPEQQAAHDAEAIAQADAEDLELIKPGPMQRIGKGLLRDKHIRRLLEAQGKLPPEQG